MAATRALSVILAAAAAAAAADTCPNLWTAANVAQTMMISPRRPARCAPETNPEEVGARKARACPNRRSAREQARAFHAHFHTTMFICLFLASD